jgi:polyhydroxyalkanoate synthesis regulator phasin
MFEVLKQSILTSIGLAGLTREKVTELVAEVAQQAKLTEQQAREFQDEVDRRSEEARKELTELVDRQIDHALIQMGLIKAQGRKAAEAAGDVFREFIDQRIDEALVRIGVAKSEDVISLFNRLDLLEKKLASKTS